MPNNICPRCRERERRPSQPYCQPCGNAYQNERNRIKAADPNHRRKRADYMRAYRERDPQRWKDYAEAYFQRRREADPEYDAKKREMARAAYRRRCEEDPDYLNRLSEKRREYYLAKYENPETAEIMRAKARQYYADNAERLTAAYRERYANNPEVRRKQRCRTNAGHKVVRQTCEVDGCNKLGERHHDDYDKIEDVRFLCKKHHEKHHATVDA